MRDDWESWIREQTDLAMDEYDRDRESLQRRRRFQSAVSWLLVGLMAG